MSEPSSPKDDSAALTRVELRGEWSAIKALLGFCTGRRRLLVLIVVLAVLAFLLEGIGIGLLIPLVESFLLAPGESSSLGPFAGTMVTLTDKLPADYRLPLIGGLVFLLILLKTVVIYGHHLLSSWLSGQVGQSLRKRLFDKSFELGLLAVQRLGIGRLHNTVDAQVWHVTDGLDKLTRIIAAAAAAAVFVTILLIISWPLTLVVVAGFLLISLVMLVVRRAAHHFGRRAVEANAAMSDRIVESLTHHRLIRAVGTEARERKSFAQTTEALRRAVLHTELLRGIAAPANELLYVPLMFAVIAIGLAQGLGVPTLLAYLLLLYRLQPHLRQLDHLRVELAAVTGPIEDIVTILDLHDPQAPRSGSLPITSIARSIRFEAVSFDYGTPDSAGLRDVSFVIPKGAVVALVGPSGAGKSTIVGLLHRFFDPSKGRIMIDDTPLPELDLATWRQRLAFAGQDLELMTGTVRENIAYGRADASDAAIREAARLANADSFIESLPGGYASPISARGLSLSGGQRQRLTLARALLRQPDLLILDEATNALDADSEHVVLERLHEARGTMSMLVIAHRLQTVRHADLVVVLDAGRVVEMGAPSKLLASGAGVFNRLWARETTQGRHAFAGQASVSDP